MNHANKILLGLILITSLSSGCKNSKAERIFGDNNFKVSITLIELYKIRNGGYPDSLQQIPFTGGYEKMAFSCVRYEKLDSGYILDLVTGHTRFPEDLSYPSDFWIGLGLKESNLRQ